MKTHKALIIGGPKNGTFLQTATLAPMIRIPVEVPVGAVEGNSEPHLMMKAYWLRHYRVEEDTFPIYVMEGVKDDGAIALLALVLFKQENEKEAQG